MFYVTQNGGVTSVKPNEEFLEVNEYPIAPYKQGYVGAVSGFSESKVTFVYYPGDVETEPVLTDFELLMQANTDTELRDLEIQQNQEMLAQQMSSIELGVLGGNVE